MSVRETHVPLNTNLVKRSADTQSCFNPTHTHTHTQVLCGSEAIRSSTSLWTLGYLTEGTSSTSACSARAWRHGHWFNHPRISHHRSSAKWDQWKTLKKWSNFTDYFFLIYIFSQIEPRVGTSTSAAQEGTKVSKGHSLLKVLCSLSMQRKQLQNGSKRNSTPPRNSNFQHAHWFKCCQGVWLLDSQLIFFFMT